MEDFESRFANDARRRGLDGHICGHIHFGHIVDRDGVLYVNDGDWVEHCTTLVEHANGTLELLHWSERRVTLAARSPLRSTPAALSAAA